MPDACVACTRACVCARARVCVIYHAMVLSATLHLQSICFLRPSDSPTLINSWIIEPFISRDAYLRPRAKVLANLQCLFVGDAAIKRIVNISASSRRNRDESNVCSPGRKRETIFAVDIRRLRSRYCPRSPRLQYPVL